jgi:hypothetical protein
MHLPTAGSPVSTSWLGATSHKDWHSEDEEQTLPASAVGTMQASNEPGGAALAPETSLQSPPSSEHSACEEADGKLLSPMIFPNET